MRRREFTAVLLLAAMTVLAGCGGDAEYIELTPQVTSATETGVGWEFEVTLDAERSAADHVWQDVRVTGHEYESERICDLKSARVEAGETVTGTLMCDRAPVVIAVQSEGLSGPVDENHENGFGEWVYRDGGTDSLLQTQSLALTDVSNGVPQYTGIPRLAGGVSEFEVKAFGYAQCELVTAGVTADELDGDRPWLERELGGTRSPDNVTVRVEAGVPDDADTQPALTPVQLPADDATAGLRDVIKSYPNEATPVTTGQSAQYEYIGVRNQTDETAAVVEYRYNAGKGTLSTLHATLLEAGDSEVQSPTIDFEEVGDTAARDEITHATASRNLSGMAAANADRDCANTGRAISLEAVAGTTTVTYAVQADSQSWTVTIASEYAPETPS